MLIEINNLSLSIGGTPILRNVNLSVGEGEIYGLLGPNGAGKSTTINAILGLLPATSGTISVLGHDPAKDPLPIYANVGVVPENNGFYGWMTAEDYLAFFASLYKISLDAAGIKKHLEQVGLAPRAGQSIGTYSQGMKQRLGLARALLADPKLLILDEPTNGLDPRGRREVHDILLDLSANHDVGILLCTHLLDDVDRMCRRIGIIDAGESVAEGEIAELLRKDKRFSRYRILLDGPAPASELPIQQVTLVAQDGDWMIVDIDPALAPHDAWRLMLSSGWPVAEITHEGGGLEDLYMNLTEYHPSDTRSAA